MDIKKWVPWNWFRKEEEAAGTSVPVRRGKSSAQGHADYSPAAYFHQEIDRMFDNFFGRWPWPDMGRNLESSLSNAMLKPTLDLGATDKEYTIAVEIPGVDEEEIKLELAADTLTIRGDKRQEKEEKEKNYYRMERSYGAFQRVLSLPEDADQDAIRAKFKNGVLTVTMPRRALPQSSVKRIAVRSVE